jgi:hypothetical protein
MKKIIKFHIKPLEICDLDFLNIMKNDSPDMLNEIREELKKHGKKKNKY